MRSGFGSSNACNGLALNILHWCGNRQGVSLVSEFGIKKLSHPLQKLHGYCIRYIVVSACYYKI